MLSPLYLRGIERLPCAGEAAYPFTLPLVHHLTRLQFTKPITFIVGENGSGKSTLLEAIGIAFGLNPEGGSRNMFFSTEATHSELHRHLKLIRGVHRPQDSYFLRAESYYNVSTVISEQERTCPGLIHSYGGNLPHERSHGESFLDLIAHRFFGNGFYLLDEPEAALSPVSQLALLRILKDLEQKASQLIIATHSPILLAYPNGEILEIQNGQLIPTAYQETGHYLITKRFLEDPEGMLAQLYSEEA